MIKSGSIFRKKNLLLFLKSEVVKTTFKFCCKDKVLLIKNQRKLLFFSQLINLH